MNQTGTSVGPDGPASQDDGTSRSQISPGELSPQPARPSARSRQPRVAWVLCATIVGLLGVAMLAGGSWGFWKDRVDRHSGFISIGSSDLHTDTYAITAELKGDGPSWIYSSKLLGDARVRATSLSEHPMFVGVAPKRDVDRYLDGVAYGTIKHLVTGELSTTREGRAPSGPPESALAWTAATQGAGEQTLVWKPRDGDWSIVLMNADASAGIDLEGDLGAKFPPLPWVAGGLLIAGAVLGALGAWIIVREIRRKPGAVA